MIQVLLGKQAKMGLIKESAGSVLPNWFTGWTCQLIDSG